MSFGERLTLLRKQHGYSTRNEFAAKLGIPSTTLRNYETDAREPGHTFLKQISEMFNVSVDYLMGLTDEPEVLKSFRLRSLEQDLIEKYRSLDTYGQETISIMLKRELERVQMLRDSTELSKVAEFPTDTLTRLVAYRRSASAGSGVFILGNEIEDTIPIPDTPLNRTVDYAIKVSGDSMVPDFYDGDVALVSQSQELNHGEVGIFIVDGNVYIKEYGEKELISRNPQASNIRIGEYDNIVCMGKVIGKL